MRHGLFCPPFDALADPATLARLAAAAEAAGWDGMFLWDHLLYSGPVRDICDPWICLAAMAAATSQLELGPMVTPLPRRRPAVVARQAATLDRLARGRLVLGFGLGDDFVGEFSRLGDVADPRVRASQLDEGLEVLAALLSGRRVSHRGMHYTVADVSFHPGPSRPGGIPLWVAGRWPHRAPLRRAARHDGIVVIQMERPAQVAELRERLAGYGADLARFSVVVVGGQLNEPGPWEEAGVDWWLTQVGPYRIEPGQVRRMVEAGPPTT